MIIPEKLKKNDKVVVIAAGKKITSEEISNAVHHYQNWGLKVLISKTIGVGNNYLAGSDELRITELQKYLDDETVKAVIFARGGYGAVRIIDKIDFSNFIKYPKWLIGFSDVTVFHNHINAKFNIATIHGIMPVFFPTATLEAINSSKKCLFENKFNYEFTSQNNNSDDTLIKEGFCTAEIVGGNLSILYSLCGSDSQLNTDGKILFIEDLFEPLYHIDRMLFNLKRNHFFDNLKGLIIGSFTDIELGNPFFNNSITSVFKEHFNDLNIPIFSEFPSGHINNNHAIIFGQKTSMKVKNNSIILKSEN